MKSDSLAPDCRAVAAALPCWRDAGYLALNGLQAIFLTLWSAFWISAALAVSLLNRELALAMARRFWAPGLIAASGARVTVHSPAPRLDPARNYVFAMNHQSMLDIPLAFVHVPLNLRFFAKRSLSAVPFLGWYMRCTGMVFVDRDDPQRAIRSLDRAVELVREGANLLTFPEGRRSPDGRLQPFKKGPFVIAAGAGVPIVPIVVDGSQDVLPPGGFRLRPGPVRIAIGDPIPTQDSDREDIDRFMARVHAAMAALLGQLAAPALTPNPPAGAPDSPRHRAPAPGRASLG